MSDNKRKQARDKIRKGAKDKATGIIEQAEFGLTLPDVDTEGEKDK